MIVRVLKSHLNDFKSQLHTAYGCTVTGRQRRPGKDSHGNMIVDVEVALPQFWDGSMSNAIYNLPGVKLIWGVMGMGKVYGWWFWNFTKSGPF